VYVGGDEAFPDIAAALLSVAPGDFVYLAGWHLELDCALDALPDGTGDPTMTPRTLLQLASDNGAEVRVLLAKNPTAGSGGAFGTYDNRPAVAFVNGLANGAAVEDDRVLEAGTHHQKIIVVKSGNGLTAFAGGMDLFHDRVSWGNPGAAPLHDVHLRITGPAASSLQRNFIRRWTDSPIASVLAPLVATVPAPGALGNVQCETAFTFGNGTTHGGGFDPGTGYAFAPNGERSLKSLVLHAIGSARQFIYVEDQYLVDPDISQALAAAAPNVSSIIILIQNTVHVNQELGDLGQYWARRKTS
jgi:phosphatidylserine/phosphatidylglycerophosphate/cardiolipin synthase-like enzyme